MSLIQTAQMLPEPLLDSVAYYRYDAVFGHAVLICRLTDSHFGDLCLVIERFGPGEAGSGVGLGSGANTAFVSPSAPSSVSISGRANDQVKTTRRPVADSDILGTEPHKLYRKLTFPITTAPQPTLIDDLALAGLVRTRNKEYTLANRSCIFFAEVVYSALQNLFPSSESTAGPGSSALCTFLSISNQYSREVKEIVTEFTAAKAELLSEMIRGRRGRNAGGPALYQRTCYSVRCGLFFAFSFES
ncbi:hypothetical protein K438DRAFT_1784335 [Mycena galopus ATCC 62051]|nr:hypothetical protein K438DRAFT_1784335 [Mycena galopus ATCC 62051]